MVVKAQDRYDSLIEYYAQFHNCDADLLKAQLMAESSMQPRAESPVGAVGLGQFMPATWREWGEGHRDNPEQSIIAACKYMRHLYSRYAEIPDKAERWKFAMAAYNAGRGNVNKALYLARTAEGQPSSFADWKRSGSPAGAWQTWEVTSGFLVHITGENHAPETLGYVKRIMEDVAI